MAEEAKWYVVHTYSGYENKVKADLEKTTDADRELGRKYAAGMVVWQCAVAWAAALVVRLIGLALGGI